MKEEALNFVCAPCTCCGKVIDVTLVCNVRNSTGKRARYKIRDVPSTTPIGVHTIVQAFKVQTWDLLMQIHMAPNTPPQC